MIERWRMIRKQSPDYLTETSEELPLSAEAIKAVCDALNGMHPASQYRYEPVASPDKLEGTEAGEKSG